MFNIDHYLKKLDYVGPVEPDLRTMRALHKQHLMRVPFDNFLNGERGLGIWDGVDIDADRTFEDVIVGDRGGVCWELNGLFGELLRRLGFDVTVMSAGVRGPDGTYGPTLEHLFNGVRLGDELWLADVGFAGPSYIEPIRVTDEVQELYGCQYRIVDEDGFHVLERRPRSSDWQAVYRFLLEPREYGEWREPGTGLPEYARQLAAAPTLIRARAIENGQLTLVGRRLLTVEDGHDQMRVLVKSDDLDGVLKRILLQD